MIEIRRIPETVSYEQGLAMQERAAEELRAGGPEVFFLLEHQSVYTIGRTRDQSSLRGANLLPHPVFETNRGGQATYHGPGQLVGYPIFDLTKRGKDLHAHLRGLEQLLIDTCAGFGITARRRDGLTGVWVENRKLASIGVGVRKWISMHGFAINVTPECLPAFHAITPCGIDGVTMSCVAMEAGRTVSISSFTDALCEVLFRG
jgi:lipoyl(octanoyl) transferase